MAVSFLASTSTIMFRLVYTPTYDKCDIMYIAVIMIFTFKNCRRMQINSGKCLSQRCCRVIGQVIKFMLF